MALAHVSSAKAVQASVGATSYTTAFTTSTGSDRLLVVCTFTNQSPGDFITGITYAGVSMTRRVGYDMLQAGQNTWLYIYTLEAPATGANNVVVSYTSTYTDDTTVITLEYSGGDQTTSTDGSNTDTQGASPSTTSITTTVDNDWLVSAARGPSVNAAASTNTTERQSQSSAHIAAGDSNAAQTPAGTFTQNWTVSSGNVASAAIAIRPSNTAAVVRRMSTLLTLGAG